MQHKVSNGNEASIVGAHCPLSFKVEIGSRISENTKHDVMFARIIFASVKMKSISHNSADGVHPISGCT